MGFILAMAPRASRRLSQRLVVQSVYKHSKRLVHVSATCINRLSSISVGVPSVLNLPGAWYNGPHVHNLSLVQLSCKLCKVPIQSRPQPAFNQTSRTIRETYLDQEDFTWHSLHLGKFIHFY